MQVKLWKNYKIIFYILVFVFCFLFNIKGALAYVYKTEKWNSMNQYTVTGYLNRDSKTTLSFNINNSDISYNNYTYDLIVFKFNKFFITYQGSNTPTYCYAYIPSTGNSYVCSMTGANINGTSSSITGNFIIQAWAYYGTNGDFVACYMSDDIKDSIICPSKVNNPTAPLTKIEIGLQNGGNEKLTYNLELSGTKYFYNYESTDIVNGLSGIESQQNTTNTYIQNFNNYVSDGNTANSETSTTNAISNLSTTFNSHLSSMNDLTQLVFAPVNFIINMTQNTCQPLVWDIPFVNTRVVVPCMSSIYGTYFRTFMAVFGTIIGGLLTYRMCIKTIAGIKGVLDAEDDKIEVVDL